MTVTIDLDAYRAKRYVAVAESRDWRADIMSAEPMANAWIYSVRCTGEVRASARLLVAGLRELRDSTARLRQHDVDTAGAAIAVLDAGYDDPQTRCLSMSALADYFHRTRHWRAIPPEAFAAGVQLLVIDWPCPSGSGLRLHATITQAPHILSAEDLAAGAQAVLDAQRSYDPTGLPTSLR